MLALANSSVHVGYGHCAEVCRPRQWEKLRHLRSNAQHRGVGLVRIEITLQHQV
jgi:hypothetical protein